MIGKTSQMADVSWNAWVTIKAFFTHCRSISICSMSAEKTYKLLWKLIALCQLIELRWNMSSMRRAKEQTQFSRNLLTWLQQLLRQAYSVTYMSIMRICRWTTLMKNEKFICNAGVRIFDKKNSALFQIQIIVPCTIVRLCGKASSNS